MRHLSLAFGSEAENEIGVVLRFVRNFPLFFQPKIRAFVTSSKRVNCLLSSRPILIVVVVVSMFLSQLGSAHTEQQWQVFGSSTPLQSLSLSESDQSIFFLFVDFPIWAWSVASVLASFSVNILQNHNSDPDWLLWLSIPMSTLLEFFGVTSAALPIDRSLSFVLDYGVAALVRWVTPFIRPQPTIHELGTKLLSGLRSVLWVAGEPSSLSDKLVALRDRQSSQGWKFPKKILWEVTTKLNEKLFIVASSATFQVTLEMIKNPSAFIELFYADHWGRSGYRRIKQIEAVSEYDILQEAFLTSELHRALVVQYLIENKTALADKIQSLIELSHSSKLRKSEALSIYRSVSLLVLYCYHEVGPKVVLDPDPIIQDAVLKRVEEYFQSHQPRNTDTERWYLLVAIVLEQSGDDGIRTRANAIVSNHQHPLSTLQMNLLKGKHPLETRTASHGQVWLPTESLLSVIVKDPKQYQEFQRQLDARDQILTPESAHGGIHQLFEQLSDPLSYVFVPTLGADNSLDKSSMPKLVGSGADLLWSAFLASPTQRALAEQVLYFQDLGRVYFKELEKNFVSAIRLYHWEEDTSLRRTAVRVLYWFHGLAPVLVSGVLDPDPYIRNILIDHILERATEWEQLHYEQRKHLLICALPMGFDPNKDIHEKARQFLKRYLSADSYVLVSTCLQNYDPSAPPMTDSHAIDFHQITLEPKEIRQALDRTRFVSQSLCATYLEAF